MKHFTWRMRALFLVAALLVIACSQPISVTQLPSDGASATKATTQGVMATAGTPETPDYEQDGRTDNDGGTVRLAYTGILIPDPAPLRGPHSEMLLREVYSGLTEIDADGQPTGALAESYSVRDDGTTYVFTLRNGLKFSDGTDITAADFAWSWARALSPKFSEGMARHVLERNPLYWGDPPKIDALVFDSPVEIAAVAHWGAVEWTPADELLPEGNRCSPGGASTGYSELGSESPPSFDDARLDVRQSLTYFRDQSEVPEHVPGATSLWDTELNLELQVLEVTQERRARAMSRFEPALRRVSVTPSIPGQSAYFEAVLGALEPSTPQHVRLSQMLAAFKSEQDAAKRSLLCEEIRQYVAGEALVVPMFATTSTRRALVQPWLRGFDPPRYQGSQFKDVWIDMDHPANFPLDLTHPGVLRELPRPRVPGFSPLSFEFARGCSNVIPNHYAQVGHGLC